MTTNLKSIAGTDFDDLFEAGAGNQLLNIYAMDGQDVGQKYLNVSQGSQVSANTGFQASDDHRTDFATTFTSDKNGVQTFLVEAHRDVWNRFYTFFAELRCGAKSTQVRPPNNLWWYQQTVAGSF